MSNLKESNQWNETREKIKNKFGKLNDKQLDGLNGHIDRLPGIVQDVYNYDYSRAVEECKPFSEAPKMTM
jgi:uncharacterized protein YjbJ (UPF0337 family)